jgi:hypothetical protein
MSVQCQDCGSCVANFKTHVQTAKCARIRDLNSKYQFKCRKCGLLLEKEWHAEVHVCSGVKVYDPETEELRLKCRFYAGFISAMGVSLDIDWDKVKEGTFIVPVPPKVVLKYESEAAESDTESIEEESIEEESEAESIESEIVETFEEKTETLKQCFEEINSDFCESVTSLQGLKSLLLAGHRDSADGEDRYYILGNKIGEFVSREYPRQPDSKIVAVFSDLQKLIDRIINTIDEREQFVNGLHDSFCGSNILAYILLNINMFDQSLRFDLKPLLISKGHIQSVSLMGIQDIVKSYSLVYAMLPISDFVSDILIDVKTNRYTHSNSQFYRKEADGYHIDPWMFELTGALNDVIIESCTSLFRKAYKVVYNDNSYREGWMSHPFLKQFIQVYKNVEIASTVFDLNHIIRKMISSTKESKGILQMKTPQSRNEEWALMSTRVNSGVPGYEMVNFFETLFDSNSTAEISAKWLKKYLGGLKSLQKEYTPSPRFKDQVAQEVTQYD